jgi:hemolysin activation/secretion protein
MTLKLFWIHLGIGLLVFCTKGYAFTTTHVSPPSSNAGVIDRTIEKDYEGKPLSPKRDVPLLEVDIPEDQLDLGAGRSVFIEEIEIEGNSVLDPKVLSDILSRYEGRELSMQDIRNLCIHLRTNYVEKGYFLARAYPPVQDIKNKKLKIKVIQGNLGKITVSGNKYYSEEFIQSYFTQYVGKPINYDRFLKSLMLINENTDLTVGAVFEKGLEQGTADIILKVQDTRPIHLYFNTNDYGAIFTTNQRTGLRLDYGNFILEGSTLSLAEVVGSPINSLTFTDGRYNFPISRSGWSGEIGYMYTHLKARSGSFRDIKFLNMKSTSSIAGGKVEYALHRSRALSTDVYAGFEYKQIKDSTLGITTSDDRLRVAHIGLEFGFTDYGNGNTLINGIFHRGIPNFLGGLPAVSKHSSRKGAGGKFSIFNLDYKRVQPLGMDWFLITNFSGQYSCNKLPVPEQFYIGGMGTIRGYPLAAALGDSGYYMNWELRFPPPCRNATFRKTKRKWKDILQFVAFVDFGGVSLKSAEPTFYKGYLGMVSSGAGVRLYGPYHFDVSIDWAVPLNNRRKDSGNIWYWKINWSI